MPGFIHIIYVIGSKLQRFSLCIIITTILYYIVLEITLTNDKYLGNKQNYNFNHHATFHNVIVDKVSTDKVETSVSKTLEN